MSPLPIELPTKAAMIVPQSKNKHTMPIAYQIKVAFAQFALLGFSPEPNAQTNNMINPTSGMNEIKSVITQSFVDMVGALVELTEGVAVAVLI